MNILSLEGLHLIVRDGALYRLEEEMRASAATPRLEHVVQTYGFHDGRPVVAHGVDSRQEVAQRRDGSREAGVGLERVQEAHDVVANGPR